MLYRVSVKLFSCGSVEDREMGQQTDERMDGIRGDNKNPCGTEIFLLLSCTWPTLLIGEDSFLTLLWQRPTEVGGEGTVPA